MSIEIYTGPMYGGKTTELLRKAHIETEIGQKILIINSVVDTRTQESISTHNPLYNKFFTDNEFITHIKVEKLADIDVSDYDVICVDEAQFFGDLFTTVLEWAEVHKKSVILSGLTSDYERKPFGQLLSLQPYCDSFTQLASLCVRCAPNKKKTNALFTARIDHVSPSQDKINVGGKEKYIPLCRECYISHTLKTDNF